MAAIARLKCVDPEGIPRRDESGQPTEPELMHNCITYRFSKDEEVFIDADIAAWLAARPNMKGRLEASRPVSTVEAVVVGDSLIIVDRATRKPIEVRQLDKSKLGHKQGDVTSGAVVVKDGVRVAPHPPESITARLDALTKQ